MSVSCPNRALGPRRADYRGDQEPLVQRPEVESAVESVGESREVLSAILSKGKRVVATRKAGLEIAQDRVDPLELWQVLGLSPGNDGRLMNAAGVGNGVEASQTIRQHRRSRSEVALGPLGNRLQGKTGNPREFGTQGVALIAERNRCHERNLVLRTPPCLAARSFAAQVSVIDLHLAMEHIAFFPLFHRPHQLVVDKPGSGITHSQIPLQSQRRQTRLGLADEVDRQEPHGQRQLGALKHRSGDQRGLMPTGVALKHLARPPAQHTVRPLTAARTGKPVRPTCRLQGCCALRLAAEPLGELRHRQTRLKLDSIHGHGAALRVVTESSISVAGLTRCARLTIIANQEPFWHGNTLQPYAKR